LVPIGEAAARESMLAPIEREHFVKLRLEKQRRQHLAGRLAARRALAKLTGRDPERFSIARSGNDVDRGRPEVWLDGTPAPELHVSIAHDRDLAAAAAARDPIGIDIELVETRDQSFEDLIASKVEKAALAPLSGKARDRAVTMLWCVKEALGKRLGVGLSRPFVELDGTIGWADRRIILHDKREHALVIVAKKS
jgi:phosphopantetheinyl transferase